MIKKTTRQFGEYAAVTLLGLLIFWPPISKAAWSTDVFRSDFPLHALFADHMRSMGVITLPHFLYESLILLVNSALPISITSAGALIALLAVAGTLTILYSILRKNFGMLTALWLALVCILVSPISLFTPHHLYFGYIGLTTYFNPTTILLKPLALAHLLLVIRILSSRVVSRNILVALITFTLLSGIAKPQYLMCLLPAITIYGALRWNELRPVFGSLMIGIFLPAAILLIWQYAFVFIWGSSDYAKSSFLFAPFAGMREHSLRLAPKLLASIALPAALLWYHRKSIVRRPELLLTGLVALIGLLYSYLLVEAGQRGGSMNFIRAGEISLFLLTIFASVYHFRFCQRQKGRRGAALWAIDGLFVLSAGSGVLLYFAEWVAPGRLL